jgi:hypothetical protein
MFQFPGLAFVTYVFSNKYLHYDLCYSNETFANLGLAPLALFTAYPCPKSLSTLREYAELGVASLLKSLARFGGLTSSSCYEENIKTSARLCSSRSIVGITEIEGGFPHSEILGSKPVRGSPRLIAAYHVLHRLSAPRHPPNALMTLDCSHYRRPPQSVPRQRRT